MFTVHVSALSDSPILTAVSGLSPTEWIYLGLFAGLPVLVLVVGMMADRFATRGRRQELIARLSCEAEQARTGGAQ